jgi:hypothetical protein
MTSLPAPLLEPEESGTGVLVLLDVVVLDGTLVGKVNEGTTKDVGCELITAVGCVLIYSDVSALPPGMV